jgi:quinol monooxygenase YgiN
MRVKPGTEGQFLAEAKEVIEKSRQEAGNIRYQLHRSVANPQQFAFYELYETHEDLELHKNAPHLKAFLERTKPITVEFTLDEYVPEGGLQQ